MEGVSARRARSLTTTGSPRCRTGRRGYSKGISLPQLGHALRPAPPAAGGGTVAVVCGGDGAELLGGAVGVVAAPPPILGGIRPGIGLLGRFRAHRRRGHAGPGGPLTLLKAPLAERCVGRLALPPVPERALAVVVTQLALRLRPVLLSEVGVRLLLGVRLGLPGEYRGVAPRIRGRTSNRPGWSTRTDCSG